MSVQASVPDCTPMTGPVSLSTTLPAPAIQREAPRSTVVKEEVWKRNKDYIVPGEGVKGFAGI